MSVIGSNILAGASGQGGGYNLTKSLRFRSSASAYLNRTFGSPTNNNKWTWSGWVKRGALGTNSGLFGAWRTTQGVVQCYFQSNDTLRLYVNDDTNTTYLDYQTSAVYRDPSAWYHVVISIDNTLSTTSALIYINGTQVTAFGTSTNTLVQNAGLAWNFNGSAGYIGQNRNTANSAFGYFDGYLAEVNFIDGLALTPSSFGETSTTTGVWIPKKYTGTYGTNGFYLDFEDTSSTAALGYDAAGSNDWTVNGISLTSGSTYDSMNDVPTLTSATTANYAVMNPLRPFGGSLSNGNLTAVTGNSGSANSGFVTSTVWLPTSGKFYFEATPTTVSEIAIGLTTDSNIRAAMYYRNGDIYINGSVTTSQASYTNNDVIGVAVDIGGATVQFYKNNAAQGTAQSISAITAPLVASLAQFSGSSSATAEVNFGQQPFAYTPPTGFVALNTFNLPTPTIGATAAELANEYFDVTLYTGTGSAQSIVNSGGFQPDWVWMKPRSFGGSPVTGHNTLYDVLRGATKELYSDLTSGEATNAQSLTSFNSNGFSVGTEQRNNNSGSSYVGWQWKANGTGVTNTAGSITSTVSANTTAGFSIVTYSANGSTGTVGHGLGVAPSMIIVKKRNAAERWCVFHTSTSNAYIYLNETFAADTTNANVRFGNNTVGVQPTSTLFTIGSSNDVNGTSGTYVAYCFAPIAGYSAFGSYTGNGSSDGTMVFTGFRPRFVMIKRTDSGNNWFILDTARDTFNLANDQLLPNSSAAESTNTDCNIDILSNGFKLRTALDASNGSGGTYIYACFSEVPFKYALAR